MSGALWSWEDLVLATGALPDGKPAAAVTGLSIDTRSLQPGDMFVDPFPSGMDAIMFSSVLDVFDAQRVETLLAKAYEALGPGGRVLIYSCNTAADAAGGIIATSLSLFLNMIATGEGMAYPVADYERMLRKAGFDQVSAVGGLPMEHAMITAVKH